MGINDQPKWPKSSPVRPAYIQLAEHVFARETHLHDWHGQVLALFEGYLLVSSPEYFRDDELERLLMMVVQCGKTLLFENLDDRQRYRLYQILQACRRGLLFIEQQGLSRSIDLLDSEQLRLLQTLDYPRALLLPFGAIRRYRRLLSHQGVTALSLDYGRYGDSQQSIHVVGIEPNGAMIPESVLNILHEASTILSFAFVMELLKDQRFAATIELVDYDWEFYANNIVRVHKQLIALQAMGVNTVTLVVEGNPEVYDMLPYLIHPGRHFRYSGVLPSAVICAACIGERVDMPLHGPGYVILSGYTARHGQSISALTYELEGYLRTTLSCFIIELYSGDFPLILRCIQHSPRPKCILVMSDIFSDNERVVAISGADLEYMSWLNEIKGVFTSLVVIDEEYLRIDPDQYLRFLHQYSPYHNQQVPL